MKKVLFIFTLLTLCLLPSNAYALDRIAVVFTNGDLYAKEGPAYAEWKHLTSGVDIGDFDLAGNYTGVIDKGGLNPNQLSIKDPLLTSSWNPINWPTAKKSAITKTSDGLYRILVLQTDGSVVMKDGVWNSGYWSGTVATGVKDIVLGGDNVGVIMTNNDFKAKKLTPGQFSHPNNTAWQLVAQNVTEAAMTNDRVAVLVAGAVRAKDGGVGGSWYGANLFEYGKAVRLGGNRLCAITQPGQIEVWCKEGPLSAPTVFTFAYNVVDFKVTSNRFMALQSNGNSYVMDGTLTSNTGWNFVTMGNGSKIQLGE